LKTLEKILKKILMAAGDSITLQRVGKNEHTCPLPGAAAMSLAGCANFSGLDTQGHASMPKPSNRAIPQRRDAVEAAWPRATGGKASATRNSTA
jgi:hypothetical protein